MDGRRQWALFLLLGVVSCGDDAAVHEVEVADDCWNPCSQGNVNSALAVGPDGTAYVSRSEPWYWGGPGTGFNCNAWVERYDANGTFVARDPEYRRRHSVNCLIPVLATGNQLVVTAYEAGLDVHVGLPSALEQRFLPDGRMGNWAVTPTGMIAIAAGGDENTSLTIVDPRTDNQPSPIPLTMNESPRAVVVAADGTVFVAGVEQPIVERLGSDLAPSWSFVGSPESIIVDIAPAIDEGVYVAMRTPGAPVRDHELMHVSQGQQRRQILVREGAWWSTGFIALAADEAELCVLEVVGTRFEGHTRVACYGHDGNEHWTWTDMTDVSHPGYDNKWSTSWLQRSRDGDTLALVGRTELVRFAPGGTVRSVVPLPRTSSEE